MKKIIVLFSLLAVLVSAFAACNRNQAEGAETIAKATTGATQGGAMNGGASGDYEQNVGDIQTSEKIGDNETYNIYYRDENGFDAKVEHYESGRMTYYYIVKIADEMGNAKQADYYTPGGTFVATHRDGAFYDSAGKEISENEFEKRLGV